MDSSPESADSSTSPRNVHVDVFLLISGVNNRHGGVKTMQAMGANAPFNRSANEFLVIDHSMS